MKSDHTHRNPYLRLLGMAALSFVAMYILMYAMVNQFSHVYNNVNQFYMAALMAAPMLAIELALMHPMYPDRRLNIILFVVSAVALAAAWIAIRQQAAVTDQQFLRSMIPHHSGAILMCERASIQDEAIRTLCGEIIRSQREEIAQMQKLLARPQK